MIPEFSKDQISQLQGHLNETRVIAITTHHKPDGDAMGSSLALYHFLKAQGHNVCVVVPSAAPGFLDWLPGSDSVINFDVHPDKARKAIADAEILFCLDFNAPSRLEKLSEPVTQAKGIKVLIDHHLDPEPFCEFEFSYPVSCATCELVYYLIQKISSVPSIDRHTAECLYTGIMTDTGSFRFSSMTADTHMVIAELMKAGASNFNIHESVYDNFSLDRTRFLGYCIKDKLVVLPEYRTAYISITREELRAYNHQTGDTEGIVNFALGIKGIKLAAFFCEQDKLIKISFRSKENFSVKEIASSHFSGGGHRNAAGGRSFGSLEDTVKRFLNLLPGYKSELNG